MRGLLVCLVIATSLVAPRAAAQLFDADRIHREQLQRDYQQQQDRAVRDYDARRARERSERAERDLRGAQRNYDAVRDFEKRLSGAITSTPSGVEACKAPAPFKTDVPTKGQGNEVNADVLFKLFMELIANAVACNMVGMITFQFGRGGQQ